LIIEAFRLGLQIRGQTFHPSHQRVNPGKTVEAGLALFLLTIVVITDILEA
jgi:hypothetical protein